MLQLQWKFWKVSPIGLCDTWPPDVLSFDSLFFVGSSFSIILKLWGSQGFLLNPILLYSMHPPIGSARNRLSAALFSVLFYDKTANEFRKGVEIVDSLSEWALEGSHSSLPSRNFWQVAWHPQLEQLRKRNSFLTEEIHVAFEQFQRWKGFVICLIVSILGFWTYQNKHNLYCHTTSFKILTTIIISWNCFPFRIYKFLHLFLI